MSSPTQKTKQQIADDTEFMRLITPTSRPSPANFRVTPFEGDTKEAKLEAWYTSRGDTADRLEILRGWRKRLIARLASDAPPSEFAGMAYRPCEQSSQALVFLSTQWPYITKQIGDAVDYADKCLSQLDESESGPGDLCEAMGIICSRISEGIDAIEADLNKQRDSKAKRAARKDVGARALQYVKTNGYPGLNALGKILECSSSTLRKAIEASPYLKARKAEYESNRLRKPKIVPIDDVILDNARQNREPETVDELAAEQEAELREEARRDA